MHGPDVLIRAVAARIARHEWPSLSDVQRPRAALYADGKPLMANPLVAIEYWPFDQPMPRGLLPAPPMVAMNRSDRVFVASGVIADWFMPVDKTALADLEAALNAWAHVAPRSPSFRPSRRGRTRDPNHGTSRLPPAKTGPSNPDISSLGSPSAMARADFPPTQGLAMFERAMP